jgi:hypothetical protein
VFGALDVLAGQMRELSSNATGRLCRDDLAPLRPTIFGILDSHRDLAAGAGVITAPDLLWDSPRWLEWWWTNAAGAPEALRINLDPSAPDFFDYTTADWYTAPQRTLTRRVAGPYVDYACTNQYAITLSTPIHLDGELLGVAAADVLVASLEIRVLPVLTGLGHPVVLANAAGRVIASNSPHWAPGMRLTVDAAPAAGTPDLASPLRSWVLAEVDEPTPRRRRADAGRGR